MKKENLSKFISKYNLAGLVESVKWDVDGGKLNTSFISSDKSVIGMIEMENFKDDSISFGVYDTSQLVKMLAVLGDDVDFEISRVGEKPVSLKLKDKSTSVNYMLADLSVIPKVPDLKNVPAFNVSLKLDTDFIAKFIKAKSALADETNFTFVSENGKSQIVLGHSNINSNRISIDVDYEGEDVKPISFSAIYFKEILVANKDSESSVLNISTDGLAHVQFNADDYKTDYYLVKVNS